MKKKFLWVALLGLLSACGGGGGGDGEGTEQPAAAKHELSLAVVGLSGTVVVADNQGHRVSISADGTHKLATLNAGTAFTLSISSQPATQACRLTESTGTLTHDDTFEVRCEAAIQLPAGNAYTVDQVALVVVPTGTANASAALDGVAVATTLNNSTLSFLMPQLSAGTRELVVTVDGRKFTHQVTVSANPLSVPAQQYLHQRTDALLAKLQTQLAGTLSAENRSLLQHLQMVLTAEAAKIDALPAADALAIARLLAANEAGMSAVSAAASMNARPLSAGQCVAHAKVVATGVAFVAMGVGLATLAPVSGPGVAVFGAVAVAAFVTGTVGVNDGVNGIKRECFDAEELGIEDGPTAQALALTMGRKSTLSAMPSATSVQPLASGSSGWRFKHEEPRAFIPYADVRLSETVSDATLSMARAARDAYASVVKKFAPYISLPAIPALDAAAALKREERKSGLDLSKLSVASTTSSIKGSVTAAGSKLALTFEFAEEPYPKEIKPFGFVLRHADFPNAETPISAELAPPDVPTPPQDFVQLFVDGTLKDALPPTKKSRYAIVEQPKNGVVVLLNETTGEYTYKPAAGFVGKDEFSYTATNGRGTSLPTKVFVTVKGCESHTVLNGPMVYTCGVTLPRSLVVGDTGMAFEHRAYHLSHNGLFLRESGDFWTYNQQASKDLGKSALAPSGTAVFVYTTTGSHDAATDSFTELVTDGTFDAVSDAPVARTSVVRRRTTHVPHRDGKSHIVGSSVQGYAWIERTMNLDFVSIEDYASIQLSGYDASGVPQYTGQLTYCSRTWEISPTGNGQATVSPIVTVVVHNITASGATNKAQEYTAATCPVPLEQFDSIAPAVTPNNMRVDWQTGRPR